MRRRFAWCLTSQIIHGEPAPSGAGCARLRLPGVFQVPRAVFAVGTRQLTQPARRVSYVPDHPWRAAPHSPANSTQRSNSPQTGKLTCRIPFLPSLPRLPILQSNPTPNLSCVASRIQSHTLRWLYRNALTGLRNG